jgi:hypothetical protein
VRRNTGSRHRRTPRPRDQVDIERLNIIARFLIGHFRHGQGDAHLHLGKVGFPAIGPAIRAMLDRGDAVAA